MTSACVVTSSGCCRLVCEQEPRIGEQRRRDHDALQHPARQLVRVLPQSPIAIFDPNLGEHVGGASFGIPGLARGGLSAAPRS